MEFRDTEKPLFLKSKDCILTNRDWKTNESWNKEMLDMMEW